MLNTERLRLDPVTSSDTDAVLEYCNDPVLQKFVPVPVPYTRETAEGYTVGYATDAPMLWAMRTHDDNRLLGVIELVPAPLASAELGYWLGAPHRGRGFMTEAMRTVVEFGLSVDGADLTRISWCAVVGNVASARAARATGFHYEGLQRRALPHREQRLDGWFASLLRDDRGAAVDPGWPV